MFEVRLHGRGGQGVVTAAELLSVAGFFGGLEAQAFPSFGSERMGAPVISYCRLSSSPIRVREPIAEPDAVIVTDATLLHHVDVFGGLRHGGYVIVNSVHSPQQLGLHDLLDVFTPGQVVTVAASDISRAKIGQPRPNVCLLGAFAALTGRVQFEALERAVRGRFGAETAERNIAAARAAFHAVRVSQDA
jgi:pyruvate ferredoxin oxidoreductase gamma subunit